jgi:DNA-dependent protein kinase catalytic subunit
MQIEYMRHIPAFIKAYTLFAAELDPIPVELMETIHRMCNTYIMGYIDISGYHRRNGVYNIYSLFCVLFKKGEGLFRNFLNDFCKSLVTHICTNMIVLLTLN